MNNQPWKQSANSLLVLYSILAATCGVFIVVIFSETISIGHCSYIPLVILFASFWLFIFSAEGITDALEGNDVHKYVAVIFLYNIAVILLLTGISSMIYLKFFYPNSCLFKVFIFFLVLGLVFHWLNDAFCLIFDNNNEYKDYIENLTNGKGMGGKRKRRRGWTTFFLCLRKLFHGKLPNP